MSKMKTIFSIIFFTLILLISTKVQAVGTVSLSTSKTTVNPGDEFNISVNISGMSTATLTVRVNADTSKVEYVSGPSNSSFNNGRAIYTWTDPNGGASPKTSGTIATFKFKAKGTGNAIFQVTGEFFDPQENPITVNYSGVTVKVEQPAINEPTDNSGETPAPEENNNQNNNQGGTQNNQNNNQPTTNNGNNQNNNQSTPVVSSNANLASLQLDIEGVTPAFSKNVVTYNLVVPDTVTNIGVSAKPENSNARVSVTGNTNLKTGSNKISIVVTAQDGTKKTYTINVTKTANPEAANANLENLAIENVSLNPNFEADIVNYTVEIENNVEKLNILAVPQVESASVQINGNDALKVGENTITITVSAVDGITQKTYTINVHKKTIEEESPQDIENNIVETVNETEDNNMTPIIVIGVIIAIIIIGVIYYIFKRNRAKNK